MSTRADACKPCGILFHATTSVRRSEPHQLNTRTTAPYAADRRNRWGAYYAVGKVRQTTTNWNYIISHHPRRSTAYPPHSPHIRARLYRFAVRCIFHVRALTPNLRRVHDAPESSSGRLNLVEARSPLLKVFSEFVRVSQLTH